MTAAEYARLAPVLARAVRAACAGADADDLAQDIWVQLLARERAIENASGYLYTAARNRAAMRARHERLGTDAAAEWSDPVAGPEELLSRAEIAAKLRAIFGKCATGDRVPKMARHRLKKAAASNAELRKLWAELHVE